jgi:hypothetical protein
MALLNWLADAAYDLFYQEDKKKLAQSNAAYQQQVQAHKQRNVLSPQQYSQQLRGAAQTANNQVAYNAPAQRQRPQPQYNPTGVNTQQITQPRPTFTPQPRVSEAIRSNTVVSQNKPNALQYFNPLDAERGLFGSKGVFGAEQQQRFTNAVAPAVNKLEEIQKNIDATDDKEGFQWDSPRDYGRFGAKLLPGMAQGIIEAPTKVGEAMSGQRVRDNKVEDINGLQRAGTLADAVISTGGLAYGGSGTFLKQFLPGATKAGVAPVSNTLQKLATGTYNLAKDAGKEGLEEVVQTFATDLADDGAVNTDLSQYRDAATLGALGGSMFHGAGKTVEYAKSIPGKVDQNAHNTLVKANPEYQQLTQQFETTTNELERTILDTKMKEARQRVIKQNLKPTSKPAVEAAEQYSGIPKVNVLNDNEAYTLSDFGDYIGKRHLTDTTNPTVVKDINTLAQRAYLAAKNAGVDIQSGSSRDIQGRIADYLERRDMYKQGYQEFSTGGYIRVGYPDAKDLPADVRSEIEKGTNFSPKTTVQDRIKNNKLTASDIPKAQAYGFTQAEMRELAKNVPDFKNNPVMTYNPEGKVGTKNSYSNDVNYEVKPTFEYESNGTKFSFDAERFIPYLSRPLLADLKAGEQVDFSQALKKGNNKIPSVTEYKPGEKLPNSLDVPKQDLIIKNGEGKAMSVEPKPEPKTTRVYLKSKFSDRGAYADVPIIRKEENITLYQGAKAGDKRQFWTPNKKYAEQFGEVREKTGNFYQIDNGNRMTDVYVEADAKPTLQDALAGKSTTNAEVSDATTSQSNTAPIPQVPKEVAKTDTTERTQKVSSTPKKSAKARTIQSPERQSRNNVPLNKKTPESQSGREPDSYPNSMTKQEIKQYVKDMNDDQDKARKSDSGSTLEKAKETTADFKEKFIDDLSPIEDRLQKAIKDGVKVDPKDHITYQLDRSRRSEGITHAYITESGLADIVQNVPNTKEFDQYLIAKHASELDSDVQTGRNKAKDQALVKALEPKYKDYAKKIYKYNRSLLDSAVDYGLISKTTATQLKKQYPEYVPFNRIFNEDELSKLHGNGSGEASISKQTAVQKIKGSQRAIESPLNSIIDKTRVVIEQGERNRAAKMLASYKDLPGNPFNLEEVPPNETIGTRSSISYLDRGVKRTFLTDKTIADAAKNMTRDQLGLWGRIAAVPARVLRSGATAANVGFAGANVVKDVVGAAINSKHPMRISDPRNFGNALAAAFHHNGKQYQELMREGVAGTSFDMFRNATHLSTREVRSQKNVGTRALYNLRPDRWYRTIEDTIGRSEDFGRALQYYSNKQGFLKEGKSTTEATILAADQARNNSTNFFRHGSWGKNINQAIPYWNASVQGARIQTVRLKQRPVQTLAKIGLAIAAPSAMIALNNYGDEEKEKVIENIPEYEKAGNIIIVGNDAKFNKESGRWEGVWKFPVPPQHLGIHNAVQNAVKSAKKGTEYDLIGALGEITQNYTTINPTNATKTANNYTPQALKLAAEPLTNTNFFTGDKIIPDSMKNLDKENQTTESTSLTAKALAKVGGLSPMMVDNVIRTATGGAGQNLVWATDRTLAQAGFGTKDEARGRDLTQSVLDRFVGARGQSDGLLYFKTLDENAKEQKLAGKDLSIFNSLVDQKMSSTGEIEGKTERDTLNKYQNLANNPRVAKTFAEAAKDRSRITGQPLDPLYSLTDEQQGQFYLMRSVPKDSADQRDLEKRNESWYKTFTEDRSKYYKALNLPPAKNSQRVPYPEATTELQAKLDTYFTLNPEQRGEMLDKNPEIGQHFTSLSTYANEVRKAQGFAPMRTYPQASERVQKLMDAGDFKDTEVAQFMQDLNMYNVTSEGALAQIQGNTMSSKGLKATKNLGYSIVKNADGTYSLKYADTQGGAQQPLTPDGEVGSGSGTRSTRSSKART